MTALAAIFATSFAVALSGAMMPGPLFTVTVSESSRKGPAAGPLLIVGHGILELALMVALVFGVGPLLKKTPVFVATALLGSIVLLWMAYGMLRSLPRLTLAVQPQQEAGRNLVVAGILLSLANPYWTIWWISIGLGYITQSLALGIAGAAAFFAGHIMADFAWYTAVAAAVWKGKRFMSDRAYRGLIAACALFLILFAGMFGYAGLKKLAVLG
ncbi:MAG: lysine transporter LysE [Deltaproteobacteria bacterium]|nr:MAG: lysine transporter LysE [Deltaproteobacteria bacterium]